MSADPVFLGTVHAKGTVTMDTPRRFNAYVRGLKSERVEVIVRRIRTKRSLDQNSYWWAVPVEIMAEYMGEDRAVVHYALLGECFGYHHNDVLGKLVPNKGSSSSLTVGEFAHLIEWCPPWALLEHGVTIPLPNEVEVQV